MIQIDIGTCSASFATSLYEQPGDLQRSDDQEDYTATMAFAQPRHPFNFAGLDPWRNRL